MAEITKGIILSIEAEGTRARVRPSSAEGLVSRLVTIPWHMRGSTGNLSKGTEVVFVIFEDQSGILFSRMDGNWGSVIGGDLTITGDATVNKALAATSVQASGTVSGSDCKAGNISLKDHTHSGVETGPSNTGGPQ